MWALPWKQLCCADVPSTQVKQNTKASCGRIPRSFDALILPQSMRVKHNTKA